MQTGLFLRLVLALTICATAAVGQGLSALAFLDPDLSRINDREDGVEIALSLSQPVPYRVSTLDGPPRLVLDFRVVDFTRLGEDGLGTSQRIIGQRSGPIEPGWSRLVLDLSEAYSVETAGMRVSERDGRAVLTVALADQGQAAWQAGLGTAASRAFPERSLTTAPPPRTSGDRLTVVLDPGHGGIDPGAVREGVEEADIVLQIALLLRDALIRAGDMNVVLTRADDRFVSLEDRIRIAKRAGGDLFVSLHADAVSEGVARGAQVYTLAEEASSRATAQLAERHNRTDLLAGVDLTAQDDEVASVLMDIARTETAPRSEALANSILTGFATTGVQLHKRPREKAAFSVLKSPDIPSVLVELGFMSDPQELAKLLDQEWRGQAVEGLTVGLLSWVEEDGTRRSLLRQ